MARAKRMGWVWAVTVAMGLMLGACSSSGGGGGSDDSGTPCTTAETCGLMAAGASALLEGMGDEVGAATSGGTIDGTVSCDFGGNVTLSGTTDGTLYDFTATLHACGFKEGDTALTATGTVDAHVEDGEVFAGSLTGDSVTVSDGDVSYTCDVNLDIDFDNNTYTGTACGMDVDGEYMGEPVA